MSTLVVNYYSLRSGQFRTVQLSNEQVSELTKAYETDKKKLKVKDLNEYIKLVLGYNC